MNADRRSPEQANLETLTNRVINLEISQAKQTTELDSQSATLKRIEDLIAVIVSIVEASKGFWKILGWVSMACKRLWPIVLVIGGAYAWLKVHVDIKEWLK